MSEDTGTFLNIPDAGHIPAEGTPRDSTASPAAPREPLPIIPQVGEPPITFDGPRTYPDDVTARLTGEASTIIARYPQPRSALLPLLHLVQSEDGYITRAGIEFCAARLDLTAAQVSAVATFYSMYRRRPTGEYLVGVCTNTLCAVMGGDEILHELREHLGVGPGETTTDGRITLEHLECNAACDFAPVVMVNWEFFDNQTPAGAVELVEDLRAGLAVSPSRGAQRVCGFRATARLLAGLPEDRPTNPPDDQPTDPPDVQPTTPPDDAERGES